MLLTSGAEDRLSMEALAARDDERRLEAFIRENKRYILSCAYKTTHRFIDESDDEWSVALIAFHEAVQTYEPDKGGFRQFASLVIRRRLLDEAEKNARRRNELAADMSGGETDDGDPVEPVRLEVQRKISEDSIRRREELIAVRDELSALGQTLSRYGVTFFDLAESSPKAQKTKTACAAVIRALLADKKLMGLMQESGTLPIKAICGATGVPRKILDNHRKYIIAAAEILNGDYPQLTEYLRYIKEGGEAE